MEIKILDINIKASPLYSNGEIYLLSYQYNVEYSIRWLRAYAEIDAVRLYSIEEIKEKIMCELNDAFEIDIQKKKETPLEPEEVGFLENQRWYCSSCRKKLESKGDYCEHCGQRLYESEEEGLR